jgi:hypothetical protein
LWGAFTKAIEANPVETNPNRMAVAISVLGNAVRDMIVSVTQTRLLLENVMPRTPSDQPSNSDLFYRARRWIAVAIVRLVAVSLRIGSKPVKRLK